MAEEFDVLSWRNHWDAATRKVIEKRMSEVPEQNFFDAIELQALDIVIEAILPGIHGNIPIKEILGREIGGSHKKGVRLANLPWRPDMYKQGLSFLREEARIAFEKELADLSFDEASSLLEKVATGEVREDIWRFPSNLFFQALVADIAAIYYSFPQSWNEITFAGPAYPYGYYQLECDEKMPWEPNPGGQSDG